MTIKELVNLLKAAKIDYTYSYNAALKEMNENLAAAKERFRDKAYTEEAAKIRQEFERKITENRLEIAEHMEPHFSEIREEEIRKAEKIDTVAFEKISALRDMPLTEMELSVINSKFGGNDYYSARMLSMIAEKNGINPATLGIVPSLDTRLSIIDALKNQLDAVLVGYKPEHKGYHADSPEHQAHIVALAALSENTLNDLVLKYTNGYNEKRSRQIAKATFERIAKTTSESERALLISNALRNTKGKNRDELLYRLSRLENLSDYTLLLSGCEDEIVEWKSGKAEQYASALNFVRELSGVSDITAVKQRILERLEEPFIEEMITAEAKNNKIIHMAISGDNPEDGGSDTVIED